MMMMVMAMAAAVVVAALDGGGWWLQVLARVGGGASCFFTLRWAGLVGSGSSGRQAFYAGGTCSTAWSTPSSNSAHSVTPAKRPSPRSPKQPKPHWPERHSLFDNERYGEPRPHWIAVSVESQN